MPFNGSGTFNLAQPAFVTLTPISSSAMNSDLSDIASGLTNALTKDGQSTASAPIKFANGSVGAPSITFGTNTNLGLYRVAADVLGITVVGSLQASFTTTSAIFSGSIQPFAQVLEGGDTVALPGYSWASDPDTGMYRIAANNVGVAVNATKILDIGTGGLNVIGSVSSNGAVLAPLAQGVNIANGTIVETRAAGAVTFALKTLAGADPSALDPVLINFRNAAAATGNYVQRTVTAATSLVISSGSTMGATANLAFTLSLVLFDDAGTVRIGAVNGLSTFNLQSAVNGSLLASSTAEGGIGGADSALVIYTGTAVTSKPYVIFGTASYSSGLATPGTWGIAPTTLQLYGLGVNVAPLNGMVPIKTQNVSNVATVDFQHGVNGVVMDGTFTDYVVMLSSIVPATNGAQLQMLVGTGSTPTYATANYTQNAGIAQNAGAISNGAGTSSAAFMALSLASANGVANTATFGGLKGRVEFSNPNAANQPVFIIQAYYMNTSTNAVCVAGGCGYSVAGAITAIRFQFGSGNVTSGRFTLYGLVNS